MQPQLNPNPLSQPEQAPRVIARRGRGRSWLAVLAFAAVAVLGWLAWRQLNPAARSSGQGLARVRTAPVTQGPLQKTIRLAGTTTAEKYVSLIAPQLRGGRGGGVSVNVSRGGGGMIVTIDVGSGMGGGGMAGGGASSGGSSSSAASSASVSSTAGMGGSGGGGTGMSSSFRGATNRFSSSRTTAASSASSSRASSTSSASASSTSSSSSGSGGGGGGGGGDRLSGGMSDFMQVIQSMAQPGSMVKKGDVVAEFDTQFQLLRLDDYKATVEQAERTLRSIDAQIDVARKSYQQTLEQAKAAVEKAKLDIQTIPVRSVIDAEILRLSLEQAQANLRMVEAAIPQQEISLRSQRRQSELDLQQAKLELERAERNVERMMIRAPMDGMFVTETTRRGSEFGQIQAGDQVFPGQMFGRIVDPSSMLVSATVNQADVESLRIGAKAQLRFDAFPELELPGHVVGIGAMSQPGRARAEYVREVPVMIKIEKIDPRVIPDLSVSADVVIDQTEDALLVPRESVFREADSEAPFVYVKRGDTFEKRPVEIRLANFVKAAVASGVKKGELVALERPPLPNKGAEAVPTVILWGALPAAMLRRRPFPWQE
ncbi:MAG: efflux RND transporter periplasmic adaptor subunit [Acidobacteriota bacterium]